MTALCVESLSAGYRGVPVVRGVSFSAEAGAVVAVLGSNGAGKSTLLNAIAGLLGVMAGTVRLRGQDVSRQPAHVRAREGLALVPQDRGIARRLTVAENLRLLPRRAGAAVDAAVELFPALGSLLRRPAGLLSGGEQQMLALARVLVLEPPVLLVDEMSAGLAPQAVESLFEAVRRVVEQRRAAVVLVEQHADLALELADRALVLRHGEQAIWGTAADGLEHPEVLESTYLGGTR
ncbi:MAG: ABC transporter ATP-binding protein [Actinomycetota bacterium]|nr:ABC transporter ATP-binding protein [Actinomycetota bacterium]